MIYRICVECGNEQGLSTAQPNNLSCQHCGSPYSRFSKKIHFICNACDPSDQTPVVISGDDVHFSICPKCNRNSWSMTSIAEVKKVKERQVKELKSDSTLKIAIPYFTGNRLVERAVRTWIIPEVVFFLTDPLIVPPGSGVCSQIFLERNSNDLLKKKEKPLLPIVNDVFSALLESFPDCDYYGYFNSDIILPPGKNVYNLLPVGKKPIVMHHRLEVAGEEFARVDELKPHAVTVVGKDGFILAKRVVKRMLKEFPEMIVGRPFWDTALALWLWKVYGWNKIDFAYREMWHASHKSGTDALGDYDLEGGKFNRQQGYTIFKNDYSGQVWKDVCSETMSERRNLRSRKIGIIQPGRVGDILLVLPIAKWYYDKGYEIVWPVHKSFTEIFERVSYVKPLPVEDWEGLYSKSRELVEAAGVEEIIDLAIGFGRDEGSWLQSGLSFDVWKYQEAKVPIIEKYKLDVTRDYKKEKRLLEELEVGEYLDGYVVTHSDSSFAHFDFNIPAAIEVEEIAGYHLFDWLGLIEGARYVYCVDSSVANLVNQLNICEGRRWIKTWHHIRNGREADRLTPQLNMWEKATFVSFTDKAYPTYINDNNAMSHIENRALKWCKGRGVDIGGGANPLPGAELFDLKRVDLNSELLGAHIKKNRDYVFSSHCLEHLDKPWEVIEHLALVLKPGGVLFLYLPHPYIKYWHPDCPAVKGKYGHKHILEPSEVKKWVEKAGLKVLEMTEEPDHYYSFYVVASKGTKKRKKSQETRISPRKVKRKLKIATVTIAYNAMPFIEPCIEMCKSFADQVRVVEGIVKELYDTGNFSSESDDGTIDYLVKEKSKIYWLGMSTPYKDKMEMQNEALAQIDADYVWLVDSDEFYLQKDIKKIRNILRAEKPEQVNVPLYNFFKTPRWIVNSKGDLFKQLTTEVPRIFKVTKDFQFVNHRPPETNYKVKKLIDGREMLRRDIRMYHFPYCFYTQVQQKSALYSTLYGHEGIKEWFYNFFVPWDEANRVELEKKWGAWQPDKDSFTQRLLDIPIPKVVKSIFKDVEGVKWEK